MVEHDAATRAWQAHEATVVNVAYRLLGSVADTDDVTQEVWLRLRRTDLDAIRDLEGWLVTVTARLCLDHLRSATVSRRAYVGPWLPDPLVETAIPAPDALVTSATPAPDPVDRVTLDDSVRMALMVVLERLSPAERTAFVLHDVFGLPFDEVAGVVGRSPAACRKLASRARGHLATEAPRFRVERSALEALVTRFARACGDGDLESLVAVLDPDATGWFDSGGHLPDAPTGPIHGARAVAELLLASFAGRPATFEPALVNGGPGAVVKLHGRTVTVIALDVVQGRVARIHAVGNPDKLTHLR